MCPPDFFRGDVGDRDKYAFDGCSLMPTMLKRRFGESPNLVRKRTHHAVRGVLVRGGQARRITPLMVKTIARQHQVSPDEVERLLKARKLI